MTAISPPPAAIPITAAVGNDVVEGDGAFAFGGGGGGELRLL
jgi:hypothetical protein